MRVWILAISFLLTMACSQKVKDHANPFFAMSFGFPDLTPSERVAFLRESGYDGIAGWVSNSSQLDELREIMATPEVEGGGFHVFGVYMPLNLDDAGQRSLVTDVLRLGKESKVPVWLTLRDADAAEKEVVDYIADVCDEALAFGTDVVLYPHDRHYAMSVEATLRILDLVDKHNLYTSIHLNHELRAGNADRLREVIRKAAGRSRLATLSGANAPGQYNQGSRDWSDTVQALKQSAFDVESFFRLLRESGYTGPIGYNNWKIPGDAKRHHKDTLAIYRGWQAN